MYRQASSESKVPYKKYFFLCWKVLIYSGCIITFCYQLRNIIEGFLDERLAVASGTITYDSLELPALTVCPGVAFKTVGPFYDEDSFLKNAFELEDIFALETIAGLRNKSLYEIVEVRNVLHGRCYTIYFKCNSLNIFLAYQNIFPNFFFARAMKMYP